MRPPKVAPINVIVGSAHGDTHIAEPSHLAATEPSCPRSEHALFVKTLAPCVENNHAIFSGTKWRCALGHQREATMSFLHPLFCMKSTAAAHSILNVLFLFAFLVFNEARAQVLAAMEFDMLRCCMYCLPRVAASTQPPTSRLVGACIAAQRAMGIASLMTRYALHRLLELLVARLCDVCRLRTDTCTSPAAARGG